MKKILHSCAARLLRLTGAQYLPVRSRAGFNAHARWTLFPWTSYWRGTHEPSVSHALASLGELRGRVCWDLGAHFGYYSVGMALRTGPQGQVVAFEPFPSSYARLTRHARMNRLDWLKTYHAAVSDSDGEAGLICDTTASDTSVHLPYNQHERATAAAPQIRIRTLRLDSLVQRGEIRRPDLVKIDVEGHGHQALAGAAETIRHSRPLICMAFHSPEEVAGSAAILDPLGYRWEALDPAASADRIGSDYLLRPE